MEQGNNRTIAKNTAFLYFRMMFTMIVSLYTSRVILQTLGVDDYGIYQSVGGIVGFLSFINSALSTGSSRFLTYELGTGNLEKLKRTFSTTLTIHIVIALFVVIVAETLGIWFLYNKLMIPAERMDAAVYTFHISILTAVFTLTQVPYNNFRTAANPQIVKKLAAGDLIGSKRLLLASTKYSYYMMFIICFPVCLLAHPLLKIWLGVVPDYTVIFLQIIVIQSLFQVFDTSFYTALYAKGRLRENALISPTLGFISFPIIYFLFKAGYSPVALSWASLLTYAVLGVIVKPILVVKIANYYWRDVWNVFKPCLLVTMAALPVPVFLYHIIGVDSIPHSIFIGFITVIIIILSVYWIGIDVLTKQKVWSYIKRRVKK